jgi:hypothetical protein
VGNRLCAKGQFIMIKRKRHLNETLILFAASNELPVTLTPSSRTINPTHGPHAVSICSCCLHSHTNTQAVIRLEEECKYSESCEASDKNSFCNPDLHKCQCKPNHSLRSSMIHGSPGGDASSCAPSEFFVSNKSPV